MKINIFACMFLGATALHCAEVKIHVVDDSAHSFAGAKTVVGFAMVRLNSDDEHVGVTDANGLFSVSGRAEHSVYVRVEAPGYYEARFDRLPRDQNLNLQVVLPKIIRPVPLFALRSAFGRQGSEELQRALDSGESFGFDLEAGALVAPFGKGRIVDILFTIRSKFNGWLRNDSEVAKARQHPVNRNMKEGDFRYWNGKWDGQLEIGFAGGKEGIFEQKDSFRSYSRLKMPHNAPAHGYAPSKHYISNNYIPREKEVGTVDVGFFLRTRVKLDKDGEIVSANYSKVMGDFQFDARGSVGFTYYFNPVPNDRNLEFDPKRNLFPANFPGANVGDP